jgi:hypothetical protein
VTGPAQLEMAGRRVAGQPLFRFRCSAARHRADPDEISRGVLQWDFRVVEEPVAMAWPGRGLEAGDDDLTTGGAVDRFRFTVKAV